MFANTIHFNDWMSTSMFINQYVQHADATQIINSVI